MNPLAHSPHGEREGHDLWEHLRAVAELTANFSKPFGADELGWWAGLWHDIGKIHPDFQSYLRNPTRRKGPDHKGAGAVLALQYAQPLAFLIAGHHGGLHEMADLKARLRDWTRAEHVRAAISSATSRWPEIKPTRGPAVPGYATDALTQEFLVRLLFSALVDADRLDTEAYFHPEAADLRLPRVSLAELWQRFEANQRELTGQPGIVGEVRHEAYLASVRSASGPPGAYRLTVPTGGGKTRSGLAFALRHALENGLERIIVAIPYTSIVEQTVDVYRSILGESAVLEHHSGAEGPLDPENPTPEEQWIQLASENWDAPIVVTTTVQLFESLFSSHPSKARKVHNLVRSVIVLDEVQTLPPELLDPILDGLRQLTSHCGASVVLSTATQPALDESPLLRGLTNVREIAPNHPQWYQKLRRVEFTAIPEPWSWERVGAELGDHRQVLAIVNTRADAARLLRVLKEHEVLHLSALMCGAHRRAVLSKIKDRLLSGSVCRVVATQVVEAGVDLDFPVVLRAIGPLDRIVQAAGRCNREGKRDSGRTLVFTPADGGMPRGSYRTGALLAQRFMADPEFDFYDPNVFIDYFRELYRHVDTDAHKIQALRRSFDFPGVAKAFRMIREDSVPVVVPYWEVDREDAVAREVAAHLDEVVRRPHGRPPRWFWRRLQPYLVQVQRKSLNEYVARGIASEILPGLWRWWGHYDPVRGLVDEPLSPEEYVV